MPALFFNFISTIVTMYAAHDLEAGFTNFRFELRKLFSEVVGGHKLVSNEMYVYTVAFFTFIHI